MATWQPTNANVTTQYSGMVVRAGAASGTVLLAQADSEANVQKIVGTRAADVLAGAAGIVKPIGSGALVRMEAEPALNDLVYLSAATPGVGVVAAPALSVVLGICYEKIQIGGVWYANLVGDQSALATKMDKTKTINEQTGTTYQPTLADAYEAGRQLTTLDNVAPITVTLPLEATVPFQATYGRPSLNFLWKGTGQPTFVAEGGGSIIPATTPKIAAQYKAVTAIPIGGDAWLLVGALSA